MQEQPRIGPISVDLRTPPHGAPGTTDFGYRQQINLQESIYGVGCHASAASGTAIRL
jgi:hypothetical protein